MCPGLAKSSQFVENKVIKIMGNCSLNKLKKFIADLTETFKIETGRSLHTSDLTLEKMKKEGFAAVFIGTYNFIIFYNIYLNSHFYM